MSTNPQPVTFAVDDGQHVSALLQMPSTARACYVMAHGAGAGMAHPFMVSVAGQLADRGIATFRYQFPYMERGSKRPDPPRVAKAAVRAAVAAAARLVPELPLYAGGKSFGGRMTSQAQAAKPLPGVRGLVFLGFPLHAPGQPSEARGEHLADVQVPMLFFQGSRDEFADFALLQKLAERLGSRATFWMFDEADHSFHVPARSGHTDAEVREAMAGALADWIDKTNEPRALETAEHL
jgi:predicted alpha/beta-hydrolase family hydrolase